MLRLVDICRNFKVGPTEVQVLKNIALTVDDGEMVAIVGTSGSGKSTLMNIIGLLDKPTGGSYFIEDREITYDNDSFLSSLRNERIGFVFQSYHLLSKLTAIENVGLPLVYRGMNDRDIKENSMEYLKKVDMHDRTTHKPNELSGGQQQRVAIARALVGKPSLILADEPTGALDTRVGQEIMNLFVRLNEKEGITVVIITHDPKVAKQCKRSVRLEDGVIS